GAVALRTAVAATASRDRGGRGGMPDPGGTGPEGAGNCGTHPPFGDGHESTDRPVLWRAAWHDGRTPRTRRPLQPTARMVACPPRVNRFVASPAQEVATRWPDTRDPAPGPGRSGARAPGPPP